MVSRLDAQLERSGRGDREPELDLASGELARELEAAVGEHPCSVRVAGHHLGDELVDAGLARTECELLEQPRADTAALVAVGNDEGDLRAP